MSDNCQKIKLLKLFEMLRQETDEQNPMTTNTICGRLKEMGISCDRRTLSKDIELLNANNYEIMDKMVGHEKGYYVADRQFSVSELRILMDAVQASGFITAKKTAELKDKIAVLGGSHSAEVMRKSGVCDNSRKHSNEDIYYTVETLEEALQNNKKVSFFYFDLSDTRRVVTGLKKKGERIINEQGECVELEADGLVRYQELDRIYRKEKKRYVVEPIALVYDEDNYYLNCYNSKADSDKDNEIITYRLDRMDKVAIETESISKEAQRKRKALAVKQSRTQSFKMFNGKETALTLEFKDTLIGMVYDRFGEEQRITRAGENLCRARVRVCVSPVFYGWVFQVGDKMRIVSPESIIQEYTKMIETVKAFQLGQTRNDTDGR